jgi:hypothetical protein
MLITHDNILSCVTRISNSLVVGPLFPLATLGRLSAAHKKVSNAITAAIAENNSVETLLSSIVDLEEGLGQDYNPKIGNYLALFKRDGSPDPALDKVLDRAGLEKLSWPAASFVPSQLSFGGNGDSAVERNSPTPPAAKLPSVSEAVGPIFEGEVRDVMSSLFRELCPWASDHSPLLSRTLNRGGNQREADIMCYVEGDNLAPCAALATSGACLINFPIPAMPPMPAMSLPAGRRFSPTDASRKGPHKYFLAEVYSGQKTKVWADKVVQLETLCERLKIRWEDQHAGVVELPPVTDITQVVGAAALIFSGGDGNRFEVLRKAQEKVTHVAAQCPNLARLAVAGRLLVIVLDMSQAPSTYVQRILALNLGRLQSIPEDLANVRLEVRKLASGMAELAASIRDLKKC